MSVKQVRRRRRKKWAVAAGMVFAAAVLGISLFFQFVNPDAVSADGVKAKEPWVVKVGDDEAFVVASEEEGQAVIEGIKDYYSNESTDKSKVTLTPQMTLEKKERRWRGSSQPLMDSEEAVAQMVVTNRVSDPLVTVTTTEQISETEPIDYKIQYRESKTLDEGEVRVVSKGKKGSRVVTREIVRANGKVLSEKTISTEVKQKPAVRIIEKGAAATETKTESNTSVSNTMPTTKQPSAAKVQTTETTAAATETTKATADVATNNNDKKKTASESDVSESSEKSKDTTSASSEKSTSKAKRSGEEVVKYALKFVGNPYVYGGTSLTKGTDCSGFTKGVYAKFGISLPRTSKAQRSSGRGVPYSKAKPGDLICYSGHVAIYMGKGKIVHASTPSSGIKVSKATYRNILTVRRIIE